MTGVSIAGQAMLRGEALAVPARMLLAPEPAPNMFASSPHVVRFAWLFEHLAWSPGRRALLERFAARIEAIRAQGVMPLCALIGGSFVGTGEAPNDLDALVIYRADAAPEAIAAALSMKIEGLDLRYVPEDADPILLIKMTCFFHTLYQGIDKGGGRGSILALFHDPTLAGAD
ncbi:MAG: hypothetical protein IIZ38_01875 [Sphingomonas sp.]|uniref:DUF6932 family protein n=1 Tax=Sphingomonas sp. TaxID=28214 RepID=UPI0025F943CC|nr:hypothetical protein [Sphingomonas sp.]MBQ1497041.1 hypothetical protein [Sphingomonas sp.]